MTDALLIIHAEVVTPRELLSNAAVRIEDGTIRSIEAAETAAIDGARVIDAGGATLIPGLVDTHNDGLEAEINPRPLVGFPTPFALANYERRAVAAGVTTSFHAVTFANMQRNNRTIDGAVSKSDVILAAGPEHAVDHHILHRCDVWSADGLDALFDSMERAPVRAMSLNDHTPGQGQMRNIELFMQRMALNPDTRPDLDIGADVQRQIEQRGQDRTTVPGVYRRAQQEMARRPYVLLSHDDDTAEKVDQMVALGVTIAEFPVSLEAARRAREHGLWITTGAPNIVRGGSVSGNQSAAELVAEGLADIICADYHSPSLLTAAWRLVEDGLCDLPAAIGRCTANPAEAFGITGRGRIAPGLRADLALVRIESGLPRVLVVLREGRVVFDTGELGRQPVSAAGSGAWK